MFFPRPPTRAEYQVLAIASGIFFLALGVASILAGLMAPQEKQQLAHLAIGYGAASVSVGVIIAIGFWLVRRFTDDS
jgi:CHASE2 domain-containing sensor protein